jgi:hypothetical protein
LTLVGIVIFFAVLIAGAVFVVTPFLLGAILAVRGIVDGTTRDGSRKPAAVAEFTTGVMAWVTPFAVMKIVAWSRGPQWSQRDMITRQAGDYLLIGVTSWLVLATGRAVMRAHQRRRLAESDSPESV